MVQIITIPDWRPTPDNKLSHKHWAVAKSFKDTDKEMVGTYAKIADAQPALGKRRVSLEIVLTGRQKKTDPFAYCKSVLDALTHCRMLVDDSSQFMEWGGVTWTRGTKSFTMIVLEDLEE